ncbi:MAG: Gfo/Idh/MocA family oxidoreductase [Solobacterium sp.]|nr:Gfo/Idh/MocA family oxidoreductase [Solobacterium sp.]
MSGKIRFGIVGSGWRSLYYCRIAKAKPDLFEMCGMVCRTEEKALRMAREHGISVFTYPCDLMHAAPDFVVVAVDKAHVLEVSAEWLRKGAAVLAETPAAVDRASLRIMKEIAAKQLKFATAEQYRLYPENSARIQLIRKDLIGEPQYLYLSLAHEYHAASLMRAFLNISPEMPYTIRAYAGAYPTAGTLTRTERITDGRISLKKRTCAVIAFADGKTCLYDFDAEQYRSLIRSSHWKLQGTRGEIFDDTVLWLDEKNTPLQGKIRTDSSIVKTGSYNPNLSQYETIEKISFGNEILYLPQDGLAGLSQDETAIAKLLVSMAAYAKGNGDAPYSTEESIADVGMAILLQEAAETCGCLRSEQLL